MTEPKQASYDGWAIVDVMGHQRYVGYVTTEAYGQAVMFRVDVPALDERTRVTVRPGYHGPAGKYLPAGTTVTEGAVPGYTKLIGSGSIYMLTPCTKEAALAAVEEMQARPLMNVALPPDRTLSTGGDIDTTDDGDYGNDDERDDDDLLLADEDDDETVGDR